MTIRSIPGLNARRLSDLAVMYSFREKYGAPDHSLGFTRWLASIPPWAIFSLAAMVVFYPALLHAQTVGADREGPFAVLLRWMPLLLTSGFALNVLISFLTMALGTVGGVFLGLSQISPNRPLRMAGKFVTQIFRNSPWLVLIFIVMLSIPVKVTIFGASIAFPDWIKAVLGLSLPIMANLSEVVRGAIQSVPTAQWEAAESLAFNRHQILWRIILPQCFKRMIPPWMNWYAILTMATPLVSLLGVGEMVTTARLVLAAENDRPDLLFPLFGFCLVTFFVYCYPIARFTISLEKRFAVKT